MVIEGTTATQRAQGESSTGMEGGSTLSTSKDYSLSHGFDAGIVGGALQSVITVPQSDVSYSITNR